MNMICREPGELKSKGILWAHLKSKSPQYLRLDNLSNNIYRFNIWRQMNKKNYDSIILSYFKPRCIQIFFICTIEFTCVVLIHS